MHLRIVQLIVNAIKPTRYDYLIVRMMQRAIQGHVYFQTFELVDGPMSNSMKHLHLRIAGDAACYSGIKDADGCRVNRFGFREESNFKSIHGVMGCNHGNYPVHRLEFAT